MSALNEVNPASSGTMSVPVARPQVAVPTSAPAAAPVSIPQTTNIAPSQKRNNNTTKLNVVFDFKPSEQKVDKYEKSISSSDAHNVFKCEGGQNVDLSRGIITRVALRTTHNSFPYPVKFDFTQGSESAAVTMDGSQAPILLWPGENTRHGETELYNAKDIANDSALEKYGNTSLKNMMARIQTFNGENYVYVPVDHEVITILQKNQAKYGVRLAEQDRRDEKYFKVDGNIVNQVMQDLHNAVLQKFKFTDLKSFTVAMQRYDGKAFNDAIGSVHDHLDSEDQSLAMEKRCHAGFELVVNWFVPAGNQQAAQKTVVNESVAQHFNQVRVPVGLPRNG